LLHEARELKAEMVASLKNVKEEKEKLNSFLEQIKTQFKESISETLKLEEFMAQYGYQPSMPFKPEDWEWEKLENKEEEPTVTPACAGEFADQDDQGQDEKIVTTEIRDKSTIDSLSVFDIGLSKESLQIVTGLHLQPKMVPEGHQIKSPQDRLNSKSPQYSLSPKSLYPKSPQPVVPVTQQSLMQDESLYAGSPCLRLKSNLPQVSYSNLSLSTVDSSCLEITPGLPNRRVRNIASLRVVESPIVTRMDNSFTTSNVTTDTIPSQLYKTGPISTPDTPDLDTGDVQKLGLETVDVTSAVPLLSSQTLIKTATDTPELPDFETVDIRKLIKENKLQEPKGERRYITPEFPKLETIDVRNHLDKNSKVNESALSTSSLVSPEKPVLKSRPATKSPEMPVLHFQY